jgi:hypothetical protein
VARICGRTRKRGDMMHRILSERNLAIVGVLEPHSQTGASGIDLGESEALWGQGHEAGFGGLRAKCYRGSSVCAVLAMGRCIAVATRHQHMCSTSGPWSARATVCAEAAEAGARRRMPHRGNRWGRRVIGWA